MRLAAIVVLCAMVAACAALNAPPTAPKPLEQADQQYLEGMWVVSEGRSRSVCSSPSPDDTSYEIEFRRTGGTVWVADSVDNDARVKIADATKTGKTIRLTLEGRDSVMTLNRIGADVMRATAQFNNPDYHGVEWIYRCMAPRHDAVQEIPSDTAIWFTMRAEGGPYFVEERANTPVQSLCGGAYPTSGITVLEFELIGPSNFQINEWKDGRYNRIWRIAGSHVGPDGSIVFSAAPKSGTPSFTVKQTGNEIYVRELDMKLMRCAGFG